ncbi:MAG: hypothetical protein ACM3SY_15305 [Candidatus Omnitrophota bacterium]
MILKNGQCKHVVLFGAFNERTYFLGDYRNSFDLLGLNSNIIAHAPDGMAAFISGLSNKKFFIDPLTHAFQQPIRTIETRKNGKWRLKNSIARLSQDYGSIIKEYAGIQQLKAGELTNEQISDICNNVLKFQLNKIQQSAESLDIKEFLEFSDIELKPEFLVAPYFYLEPDNLEKELEDNIRFLNKSKDIEERRVTGSEKKQVFAEITIHNEVLADSEKSIKRVVHKYKKDGRGDGFLIWVDNFSEVSATEAALKKYKDFLKALGEIEKPIIALHGSYFSIVLSGKESLLAGVGHGIEYGEHRPVVPVGGGVPLAKFYFPKFHKRVNYSPDAQDILYETNWINSPKAYFDNVCSCKTCKEIIIADVVSGFKEFGITKISDKNGKAYPDQKAMDKSRRHYLNTKIAEYKRCASTSIDEIVDDLQRNHSIAEEIISHPFTHLKKWANVLSNSLHK